jgi:hypothetical protein
MASRFPGDKNLILYAALLAGPPIVIGTLIYRGLVRLDWI